MKLRSCYIENYGVFSQKDFYFNEGLTEYCKENGFGKTTLASFIKAMFYGLPSYKTSNKNFNDREHFYPFTNGKFGGNITFEKDNKEYKIVRVFDKKSDSKDEVHVYCNGSEINELSDNIGKSLFGLDEASFTRTLFINNDDLELTSTSSISAKLNNLVDATDNQNNFDSALTIIEKFQKTLKTSRNDNGLIISTQQNINNLLKEKEDLEFLNNDLDRLYDLKKQSIRKINDLEMKIRSINDEKLLQEKWHIYFDYEKQLKQIEEENEELDKVYLKGIPTVDEINELGILCDEKTTKTNLLDNTEFNDEKVERIQKLYIRFENGIPTNEILDEYQKKLNELSILKANDTILKKSVSDYLDKPLYKKFSNTDISDDNLINARKKIDEYKNAIYEAKIDIDNVKIRSNNTKKPVFFVMLIFIVLGFLALAVGIGLLFVDIIPAVIVIVIGIILFVIGGVLFLKNETSSNRDSNEVLIKNKNIEDLEKDILAFLLPLGYRSDNGVITDYNIFEKEYKDYQVIKNEYIYKKDEYSNNKQKFDELVKLIENFFRNYKILDDNYANNLVKLKTECQEYISLAKEKKELKEKQDYLISEIKSIDIKIQSIFNQYNLIISSELKKQIKELEDDVNKLNQLKLKRIKLIQTIESYKESNNLVQRPTEEILDSSIYEKELSDERKSLAIYNNNINEIELELEKLPRIIHDLEVENDNINEYKKKYFYASEAIAGLKLSEESLKNKYILPIKNRFIYYSNKLEKTLGVKVNMDQDFNVTFERNGENRSDKHLSDGQHSLCELCLRLALIDNMFSNEDVFIILDEPFNNLDEGHMSRVKELMNELINDKSKGENNLQIIYFCCHNSRSIV